MLYAIRHSKLAPAVLSALIFLGMWGNAMAALFCPHMMGSSDCCLMQKAHSHDRVSDSGRSMARDDMDHTQMSDMDMQGMDMADMEDATSQPAYDPMNTGPLQFAPDTQANSEAITKPDEPCSHCMMHSPSGANSPVSIAGQNNPSYQIVGAATATGMLKSVLSSLTFVELHDHGPPGLSAPLYVLVSAFRI